MLMVQWFSLLDSSFIKLKYASSSLLLMGPNFSLTLVPLVTNLLPAYRETCKELEVVAFKGLLRSSLVWTELAFGSFVPKVGDSGLPRDGQPKVKNSGHKV